MLILFLCLIILFLFTFLIQLIQNYCIIWLLTFCTAVCVFLFGLLTEKQDERRRGPQWSEPKHPRDEQSGDMADICARRRNASHCTVEHSLLQCSCCVDPHKCYSQFCKCSLLNNPLLYPVVFACLWVVIFSAVPCGQLDSRQLMLP